MTQRKQSEGEGVRESKEKQMTPRKQSEGEGVRESKEEAVRQAVLRLGKKG